MKEYYSILHNFKNIECWDFLSNFYAVESNDKLIFTKANLSAKGNLNILQFIYILKFFNFRNS